MALGASVARKAAGPKRTSPWLSFLMRACDLAGLPSAGKCVCKIDEAQDRRELGSNDGDCRSMEGRRAQDLDLYLARRSCCLLFALTALLSRFLVFFFSPFAGW
jgi:hypothetical protein